MCLTAEIISSYASEKLYSLVDPYLIDIFRQAVNLVGARHREIFSQDHKRFFPSNVYPRERRVKWLNTRVGSNKRRGNVPVSERDDAALPKPHFN